MLSEAAIQEFLLDEIASIGLLMGKQREIYVAIRAIGVK